MPVAMYKLHTHLSALPKRCFRVYHTLVARSPVVANGKSANEKRKFSSMRVEMGCTGLSGMLLSAGIPFSSALVKWFTWIRETAELYPTVPIWFAAHNGSRFDLEILLQQEQRHGSKPGTFLRSVNCNFVVDTLVLSRALPWPSPREQSHSLVALYSQVTGKMYTGEHTALGDSRALAELMDHQPFLRAWQTTNIGVSLSEALAKKV